MVGVKGQKVRLEANHVKLSLWYGSIRELNHQTSLPNSEGLIPSTHTQTMPPKQPGANAKKETGRAKKADNEVKKAEAAAAAAVRSTSLTPLLDPVPI